MIQFLSKQMFTINHNKRVFNTFLESTNIQKIGNDTQFI